MNDKWLIWSIEHNAWWAPKRNGYVEDVREAGQYSYDEAIEIVQKANQYITMELLPPNEAMIKL